MPIKPLDPQLVDYMRSTWRERRGYAVGARPCCPTRGGWQTSAATDTGPVIRLGCYRRCQDLCDLSLVAQASVGVAAGTAFTTVIVPTNTQYFEPVAAEVVCCQQGNENANVRIRFTAVSIADSPQFAINTPAPVAGTTAFFYSDHYLAGTHDKPLEVPWGLFSVAALTKPLNITGFNSQPVAVNVEWTIWGNPLQSLPNGCDPGEPYHNNGKTSSYMRNQGRAYVPEP